MSRLILIRGVSGSGKSTLAKSMINPHDYGQIIHLEADMFFVDEIGKYEFDYQKLPLAHAWCLNSADRHLRVGGGVIVSNTFARLSEMFPYFLIAQSYNIVPNVILCQGMFQNVHGVPQEKILEKLSQFEYDISSLFELVK